MRQWIARVALVATVFCLLIVSIACNNSDAQQAESSRCDVITGTGTGFIDPERTTVTSQFNFMIGGEEFTAQSVATVMGVTEIEADGTVHFLTSADFEIVESGLQFTTINNVRVDPPVNNISSSQLHRRVITGDDRYNCGETLEDSTVAPSAQGGEDVVFTRIVGKLCNCR